MGLIFTFLAASVCVISLYLYLKVLYKCVRKVRITKLEKKSKRSPQVDRNSFEEPGLLSHEFKQAPGPLPWPIFGNLALLGRFAAPFQGFTELSKQFGDVYTLTLGTTRCLIVNNLDLIREVLNENGKYFGGRPDFLRFHVLFGGDRNNSLALCDWSQLQQKRRNLARKHCSPRDASPYYQKLSEMSSYEMQEFMERLRGIVGSSPHGIKLKPILQQTCANLFIQYMCSIRFSDDDIEFQHIVRCFDEIFWEINQGYAVDFLPWLSPFYANHMNKIIYWSKTIRTFILQRIINNRECNIDIDEPEKDFTDALLKSLVEDKEVSRDNIIFMLEDFIGGHSAVGNLVFLALALIVRNPETGKKMQKEIDSVINHANRNVNLMDSENMPYTVATIYEVLRYCSSPIVPHVATEDTDIAGYGVTKGTVVFINNYVLNTSPKYWENPGKFDPDRFIENKNLEKLQLKKNIPFFLPFSIGKRTCIGQNLVKYFSFIILANIMHKFNVACTDVTKIKTYPACVAVPPETFFLSLTLRQP